MSEPLPPAIMAILPQWVALQRWYAGKGRIPVLTRIGGLALVDPAGEVDINVHLLLDESGRIPTVYQVPLTARGERLAGAERALVATVQTGHQDDPGVRYLYDAPHDPAFATALLRLMLNESSADFDAETRADAQQATGEQGAGAARGHRLAATEPGEVRSAHVLAGEQSNTSIIIDLVDSLGIPSRQVILKLFRVLQNGENPDVVVQAALSAAGSARVPASFGYVGGQWPDTTAPEGVATGHLAFAQEFLPGVEDAWRVALAAVASGADFTAAARSLGRATAEVHETLAAAMGTRPATDDDVLALSRSMRARHGSAVSEVPALAEYDKMIQASIDAVTSVSWPALQRIHGDFHLGQVLDVAGRGWVLVDFEGEPLRPLSERTQPDLALRDVAGMLRSFDYVAGAWEHEHPERPAARWAHDVRAAFLQGYTERSGRDQREDGVLLAALELDKALYEVIYEARNRPTWLAIPTRAVARLSAARRSDQGP